MDLSSLQALLQSIGAITPPASFASTPSGQVSTPGAAMNQFAKSGAVQSFKAPQAAPAPAAPAQAQPASTGASPAATGDQGGLNWSGLSNVGSFLQHPVDSTMGALDRAQDYAQDNPNTPAGQLFGLFYGGSSSS